MIKLTNEEKKEWDIRKAQFGFKTFETAYFDTEEYRKLRHIVLDNLPNHDDERLKLKFCNINNVLNAGREVLKQHTNGIDIRVLHTNGDYLATYVIEQFGDKPKKRDYVNISKFIENNAELIKVTEIPVSFEREKDYDGFNASTFFYGRQDVDIDFYKKLPIVNCEIHLEGPCTDLTKSIYVHEMYHTLIDRNKGNVENFLHNEMISIFMEKVAALDLDVSEQLLEKRTLYRLLALKNDIIKKISYDYYDENHLDNLISQTYIISTLCATALFNTYKKGSKKIKKEIDDEINKVLLGERTVEDVMDKYEVTPEEGSKLVKKQAKRFSK